MIISARYTGPVCCPKCGGKDLRSKGRYLRKVRHESLGMRRAELHVEARKWLCKGCGAHFRQRFPGILCCQRATEPFRNSVFTRHWDGISRSRLAKREGIASATVERWFQYFLERLNAERKSAACPAILGIDEHFFTRKLGYATTFCDLRKHKVYDVVLGRSALSLEAYLGKLEGKHLVKVVCMDLSVTYRAIVRKHFPNAKIVADRFHVIRLVNHHFLACWRDLDPVGAKNRGLLSLLRRHQQNLKPEQSSKLAAYLREHPALEAIYRFKQRLCTLLLTKHRTRKQWEPLSSQLINQIQELRDAVFAPLVQLGETFHSWAAEIATMWRFTRNNGITEGFHTKMEVLQRQAYGFRNFSNYRKRVRVMCY
ncbi:MAG: ISL3 family transposase [Terriglobia bacterium]